MFLGSLQVYFVSYAVYLMNNIIIYAKLKQETAVLLPCKHNFDSPQRNDLIVIFEVTF